MPDDKKKSGKPDRSRINVHQRHEVAYWIKRFGISAAALKRAVADVGVMVRNVERELKSKELIGKKRAKHKGKTRVKS